MLRPHLSAEVLAKSMWSHSGVFFRFQESDARQGGTVGSRELVAYRPKDEEYPFIFKNLYNPAADAVIQQTHQYTKVLFRIENNKNEKKIVPIPPDGCMISSESIIPQNDSTILAYIDREQPGCTKVSTKLDCVLALKCNYMKD